MTNEVYLARAMSSSFFSHCQDFKPLSELQALHRLMREEYSLTMLHAEATQIIVMEKWESLCIKSGHCWPDNSLVIPILSVKKHKYIVKFVSLFYLLTKWSVPMQKGHSVLSLLPTYSTLGVTFWLNRNSTAITSSWRTQHQPSYLVCLESRHISNKMHHPRESSIP